MEGPSPELEVTADTEKITRRLLRTLVATKDDVATMLTCLKELGKLSQRLGPSWRVRAFGSTASGFFTHFSDVDATCYQVEDDGYPVDPTDLFARFQPLVLRHDAFTIVEEITAARIPILKLRYLQTLDVDLSFQNTNPFANTQLLKAYATLDGRVRQLVSVIKVWAKAESICGAPDGHLSSYTWSLMTLYFLMVDHEIQMPCFDTKDFDGGKQLPQAAQISWQCPLGLPALIHRFFEFYGSQYYWGQEVVSIRTGARLYTNNPVYSELSTSQALQNIPHIEDPFLLNRNLNCVLGWDQNTMLQSKLQKALQQTRSGRAPFGFYIALSWYQPITLNSSADQEQENEPSASSKKKLTISRGGDNPQSGGIAHLPALDRKSGSNQVNTATDNNAELEENQSGYASATSATIAALQEQPEQSAEHDESDATHDIQDPSDPTQCESESQPSHLEPQLSGLEQNETEEEIAIEDIPSASETQPESYAPPPPPDQVPLTSLGKFSMRTS
jgi:hypothetical protein